MRAGLHACKIRQEITSNAPNNWPVSQVHQRDGLSVSQIRFRASISQCANIRVNAGYFPPFLLVPCYLIEWYNNAKKKMGTKFANNSRHSVTKSSLLSGPIVGSESDEDKRKSFVHSARNQKPRTKSNNDNHFRPLV